MDWMEQEQERELQLPLQLLHVFGEITELISLTHRGTLISQLKLSVSKVLDGAVAVFDGVAGVEPQSETVWRQADKYEFQEFVL